MCIVEYLLIKKTPSSKKLPIFSYEIKPEHLDASEPF